MKKASAKVWRESWVYIAAEVKREEEFKEEDEWEWREE